LKQKASLKAGAANNLVYLVIHYVCFEGVDDVVHRLQNDLGTFYSKD